MASGKFVLRVGQRLHEELKFYSERRDLSLNAACVELLEKGLSGEPSSLPFGLDKLLSPACSLAPDIIGLVLYGSQARGEATGASDIDILAVLRAEKRISRSLYTEMDRLLESEPSLAVMLAHLPQPGRSPGSLWLEVAQDGRVLFDSRCQVSSELSRIRREIAAGRFVRRESHGQGYWVHAE